uniref:Uncharacterized protein n=1 Tax=Octactis speculum TaxID=3111310 RepID=A0A7S2FJS4_9STRA
MSGVVSRMAVRGSGSDARVSSQGSGTGVVRASTVIPGTPRSSLGASGGEAVLSQGGDRGDSSQGSIQSPRGPAGGTIEEDGLSNCTSDEPVERRASRKRRRSKNGKGNRVRNRKRQ